MNPPQPYSWRLALAQGLLTAACCLLPVDAEVKAKLPLHHHTSSHHHASKSGVTPASKAHSAHKKPAAHQAQAHAKKGSLAAHSNLKSLDTLKLKSKSVAKAKSRGKAHPVAHHPAAVAHKPPTRVAARSKTPGLVMTAVPAVSSRAADSAVSIAPAPITATAPVSSATQSLTPTSALPATQPSFAAQAPASSVASTQTAPLASIPAPAIIAAAQPLPGLPTSAAPGPSVAPAILAPPASPLSAIPAPPLVASAFHVNPLPHHPIPALDAVHYRLVKVGSYGCHVVDIDLNNPGVRIVAARSEDWGHTRMTFPSLVQQYQPLAAITGTFFDPSSGTVICNLVQGGKLLTDGHHGNSIMVDPQNKGHFLDTANRAGHEIDWSKSEFAISCGPTLLRDGRLVLDPPSEGFHDPGLFRHASRCGLGLTNNNHLLFVTVNKGVTLGGFAHLMKSIGASDAINLDGGSSTGLYVRGHYPSRPARSLTNLVMVTLRPEDPVPSEIQMEAGASSEATAPPNVEDFSGPAPSPDRINVEQDADEKVQPIAPQP